MKQLEQSPPDLLTRQETAARLRISTVTLDAWTREGRGPLATRLGKKVFYRLAQVERFLALNTESAG